MEAGHGAKAQGQRVLGKLCVARHSPRMSKQSAHTLEKAYETAVRQKGKKACKEVDD